LAGLQIWVHSRQFPDSEDYWDGNWLNVSVHCGSKGASVLVSGSFVRLPELLKWAEACEEMYAKLSGRAELDCMEPYLSVEMEMEELGHVSVIVSITPDLLAQEHKFSFEIDQSFLPALSQGCRKVLTEYPIRQDQG